MPTLPPSTKALLLELGPGALMRRPRSELLEDLSHEPSHPRVALELAPWLLLGDPEVSRGETASLIDRIIRSLAPKDVLWFSRHRRNYPSFDPQREAWLRMQPADLGRLEVVPSASTSLLCMASLHPSGYVRQAAVERLARVRERIATPFLIIHANDWVPAVRMPAKNALFARIAEASSGDVERADELLESSFFFDRLASLGREDHTALRTAFASMLTAPAFRPALLRGMSAANKDVRARCYRITLDLPDTDVRGTLAKALHDKEGWIRLWAARKALQLLSGDDLRAALEVMRKDKLSAVRHEAVYAFGAKTKPPVREGLEAGLLDPSAMVRWTARHFLVKLHNLDPRAFYLRAIEASTQDPKRLASALAGLGECGQKPHDKEHILPFLHRADADVRKCALVALDELAEDSHSEELIEALSDERASIAREAAKRLKKRVDRGVVRIETELLASLLERAPRAHTRRMAARLTSTLPAEEAERLLLVARNDNDPQIASEAKAELARRFEDYRGRR